MQAVAKILPFRTNNYVVEELIDWSRIPEDPLFQLTFPQPQMLHKSDLRRITELLATETGYSPEQLKSEQYRIRTAMNPHPAGQLQLNVPEEEGEVLHGMQHKYDETVLFSQNRDKPVTHIVPIAFDGHNLSVTKSCRWLQVKSNH